jgi:DNA mismatch endonuclease (patch repair protein)
VNLGQGRVVPYPEPSSTAATTIGRANVRKDTKPEIALRSALHRRGLRFRKDLLVRFEGGWTHPDVVFTKAKVAAFVDGCFWHCCPIHGQIPKANPAYWVPKLRANVERDRRVDAQLRADGWTVVRVWEHEPVEDAADQVAQALRRSVPTGLTAPLS